MQKGYNDSKKEMFLKAEWGCLLPLDSTHEVDEIEAGKEAQAVAPIIYFANDADVIGEAC